MTQHNDMIRLQHMLDHAKEAVALIAGKGRAELQRNRVLELALIRLVEIVGEASAKVSSETQAKYPSIPWPQVIGMRNRLIHGYDSVDLDVCGIQSRSICHPLLLKSRKLWAKPA